MNAAHVFFIVSALLCIGLAIFADPIFRWSNQLARKLGFHKLADFREGLWPVLGIIARIVLVVTAILILAATWHLANHKGETAANKGKESAFLRAREK